MTDRKRQDDVVTVLLGANAAETRAALAYVPGEFHERIADFGDHLHRSEIEAAIGRWRERALPVLVSTMNPAVIDQIYCLSEADAVNRFLFVRGNVTRPVPLTDEQAYGFWAAYQAGIMHVSEILLTHGIW